MSVTTIAILGSTGSIGVSTLDVLRRNRDRYQVTALAAGRNIGRLADQVREFRPQLVAIQEATDIPALEQALQGVRCEIVAGESGAIQVATHPEADKVVSAMVGAVGLKPTYAAIGTGRPVLLANKETLVMAGECMMAAAKDHHCTLLPIDSEHSAIYQSLQGQARHRLTRIILTASGGPFRTRAAKEFEHLTRAEALAHPNWNMGPKITIDSATMMNKGLELIEAMWLFTLPPSQIDIVVHPQSIVHSMVEYCDGSIVAQLSNPDMRGPISYALAYPDRMDSGIRRMDFTTSSQLTFEAPDPQKFPALRLARAAAEAGGTLPAVMNAANEVAVAAFLDDQIQFTQIAAIVEDTMSRHVVQPCTTIDQAVAADRWARDAARKQLR
jgi:1-deoxy-D-xylulose-5-phosphate reductoisomerase